MDTVSSSRIIKYTEGMLAIGEEHLVESNPYNPPLEGFLTYDGGADVLLTGQRKAELLDAQRDMVKLPLHLGHVTLRALVGDEPITLSDRQFTERMYERSDRVMSQFDKISYVGKLLGSSISSEDLNSAAINRAGASNDQFTPQEVFSAAIEILGEYTDREVDVQSAGSWLSATGVLSDDARTRDGGIVSYYYLCKYLADADEGRANDFNLRTFPFKGELLDEFKKLPDARFGDELLIECENPLGAG